MSSLKKLKKIAKLMIKKIQTFAGDRGNFFS